MQNALLASFASWIFRAALGLERHSYAKLYVFFTKATDVAFHLFIHSYDLDANYYSNY
jgi:hypothetical protein